MKIAFILPSLANKGPVIVARDLVNEMVKREGIKCTVFYLKDIVELEFDCEVIHFAAANEVDLSRYDIVHSHMFMPNLLAARRKKYIRPAKLVATLHSYMDKDMKNTYGAFKAFFIERIWCAFLNRFDKVVCLSGDMQRYYGKRINKKLLTYIYNGRTTVTQDDGAISDSDLQQIMVLKKSHAVIGAVAGISKIKGYDQLVRALATNPKFALLVIGDGVEREPLMRLANELGVAERCLFLGYRSNATDYFRYFDVYGLTSISEGFPLVLLEAASRGIPTVCSDLPNLKEMFDDKEVCFYKLHDIADLSSSLDRALRRKEDLSERIKKRYNENYRIDIICDKYLALFRSLL
ncbi:glycosyltransferase [Chitinophaga oryzae]|uniref:Glycosyltransferase n=1 Tax=Chitinophaga oryzae TaxID=2725414 RepID=A0AAE6ZJ01_9BACT|nr:glycosyltransferase [Chitinophaga oryzae]QJB34101.1 glycosyltransferase [Chitinophaga oryzae]QJB40620.1 glycosyltransferase [Chitinophaga oryzae]